MNVKLSWTINNKLIKLYSGATDEVEEVEELVVPHSTDTKGQFLFLIFDILFHCH